MTCSQGHTVPLPDPGGQHHQRKAAFRDLCSGCYPRERCTKAKAGRILTIRSHDLQAASCHQAATAPGRQDAHRHRQPPAEHALAGWPEQRRQSSRPVENGANRLHGS
ncbi:transposase [Streptomyces sp. NBC_01077]|uniref:transposase n=1 Tax=Streptomyces sp. NBC_01077 TaxID=2903746 RepID=UPI003869DEFF